MPEQTFYWHDYETFGRVPRRDRPAQFAGIRTDADLNEIGAPLMTYCQPSPDYLPDPEACLLTGILPQTCLEQGLPEHAFAAAIEHELAEPGTIGVGYNSIRFDDEVTRHLFWRNLIDPYAREWQNDCGRWDLLDVVRTTWALRPEGIEWPRHEDGRPSFKLEHLTRANGLAHEAAHDALSDVRATIALARLIREHQPRLWEFCLRLRKKDAVLAEIDPLNPRPCLHISGMYPVERGCMGIVWPLAQHPHNKNEIIVWDLAADPQELAGLDADTIRLRLFTRTEDLPEGITRLPLKTIHINKSPIVVSKLGILTPEVITRWQLDMTQMEINAARAQALNLSPRLWQQVYRREEAAALVDVDEDLYGGFVGNADRRTLNHLRSLEPAALAQSRVSFEDSRLEELLFRYRARNFPESLNDQEQLRWHTHCVACQHEDGGTRNLNAFFELIDRLGEEADERGEAILGALYDYAEQIALPPA
ncbi:MAG: exodeoxyribonuclease I [Candidatus Dactylopiibacterium carminicum]|uniref:Exodeoxyribonuclease I n=1 Tax=Candidatus Dactylopiibacterium carminicum TaxID=857335 RepID=A0A272ET98_9RHOO|nr:exodeoxyribonuclease I [Candidatus Dactylopiibacterium carminicum]KAF7599332.1 exodeoxyribonuclease I [Candidatus Dactylopiibacterium carminicum]PAS93322.1 MAG: exodeoxyribonuclease I [Candidatus Dactylopiibacterium carminicum]PAS94345.1 MAG: exodeoxyribonuclease I [Candidatus Dactylopiibacterium carminicum]PAS99335.1 MAG: exodeoxyribonuclease I [Candidatus Dactylopiibacterium carminicum]